MHALIIEQDSWVTLMIEDALADIGYTSFAFACTPEAALEAADARCPDLITSDLRFGSGTAIEAVRRICSGKAIPVVFITSTPWEVRESAPDAVVVPKPFGAETLKEGVGRAAIAAAAAVPPRGN